MSHPSWPRVQTCFVESSTNHSIGLCLKQGRQARQHLQALAPGRRDQISVPEVLS